MWLIDMAKGTWAGRGWVGLDDTAAGLGEKVDEEGNRDRT